MVFESYGIIIIGISCVLFLSGSSWVKAVTFVYHSTRANIGSCLRNYEFEISLFFSVFIYFLFFCPKFYNTVWFPFSYHFHVSFSSCRQWCEVWWHPLCNRHAWPFGPPWQPELVHESQTYRRLHSVLWGYLLHTPFWDRYGGVCDW